MEINHIIDMMWSRIGEGSHKLRHLNTISAKFEPPHGCHHQEALSLSTTTNRDYYMVNKNSQETTITSKIQHF